MHQFWPRQIAPMFSLVSPHRILQLGAEDNGATERYLDYCTQANAHVDIVEAAPPPGFRELLGSYPSTICTLHTQKTLTALPLLAPPDVVLMSGNYNWHTTYRALSLIFSSAAEKQAKPPLVLVHGAGWPYARRDMYRDPNDLAVTDRHAYAYRGVFPGQLELTDDGFNAHLANALHEGGPRNGVLTAIEDFINSSRLKFDLYTIPYFNGLAILVHRERAEENLTSLINSFFEKVALAATAAALEETSMRLQAELAQTQAQLMRRTDALVRARKILARNAAGSGS